MNPLEERVRQLFGSGIEAQIAAADALSEAIAKAAERMAECLLNDKKILVCGAGVSAANAQHFSCALINHFGVERPSLPVINLSADNVSLSALADENHYDQLFSRQILALGQPGDLLLNITTSGQDNGALQAVQAANERGLDTIALCGREGGVLSTHLGPSDLPLYVNADSTPRVREIHLFILHCFCDLIDQIIFRHTME